MTALISTFTSNGPARGSTYPPWQSFFVCLFTFHLTLSLPYKILYCVRLIYTMLHCAISISTLFSVNRFHWQNKSSCPSANAGFKLCKSFAFSHDACVAAPFLCSALRSYRKWHLGKIKLELLQNNCGLTRPSVLKLMHLPLIAVLTCLHTMPEMIFDLA